ncbi:MAG: sigma-70 family RNA polymerase sigma factor [Anaerolineae bacterium]|nr:sigma-70 family RNA polymerase sigma factor [Anaerolineae bacterium]
MTFRRQERFDQEKQSVAERLLEIAAVYPIRLGILDRVMSSESMGPLVLRAQRGDQAAIEALYQQFAQPIYRYVAYRVATAADAEDLTAEVFVSMLKGLPSYRQTGVPFEAWLYRIASARIADHYRRMRTRPQADLADDLADSATLPEDRILALQEIETLRRALRQLTDEEQTLVILRFVERKSHQEVADVLGRTPKAVRSMQYRALIRLASLLGSEEKVRHYLRGEKS